MATARGYGRTNEVPNRAKCAQCPASLGIFVDGISFSTIFSIILELLKGWIRHSEGQIM